MRERRVERHLSLLLGAVALALALVLAGCGGTSGDTPHAASTSSASSSPSPSATLSSASPLGTVTCATSTSASTSAGPRYLFTIDPAHSSASYRAHDSLFNNIVVGTAMTGVKGQFLVTAGTTPTLDALTVSVSLDAIHTDSGQRDADVDDNVLQTGTHPLATFAFAGAQPIPASYASGADVGFDLAGTLTLHGQSHPETLHVQGTLTGKTITGAGAGTIHMSDFGISAPNIVSIVRVDDTLGIAVTFTATARACA